MEERADMDGRRLILISILTLAAIVGVGLTGATAQTVLGPMLTPATEATTPVAGAQPSIAEKRAENAEQIRVAQNRLETDPENPQVAAELATYKTAETILAQQEAVDQQIAESQARETELKQQLEAWKAPTANAAAASISFVDFDRLVNRLAAEQARIELVRAKLKSAKSALEQAQSDLDAREQERRKAQEQLELGKAGDDAAKLAEAADAARRASSLAADNLTLRKKELERERIADAVQSLTVELLKGQVDRYQPSVVFTQADLDEQLKKLDAQEQSIRATLTTADKDATAAAAGWSRAKRALDAAAADSADTSAMAEEVDAWQRTRDLARERKNTALDELLQVEQLRTAWKRLFTLMSGNKELTPEQLATWKDETNAALRVLIGSSQSHLLRIDELRGELATILSKYDAAKDGADDLRHAIARQREYVEAMIRLHETSNVSIDASRRLHGKLRTELGRGIDLLSPEQWAHSFWSSLVWVWDYEIVPHKEIPITVGKILRAIVLFAAGWLLSRVLSTFFAHRILKRFRLSKDATAVIRTIIFYVAVCIAALVALNSAHIPLTAFTILGGAIAIGVGFGSQALMNNFVSGLIMLAERPVRIGERVLFGNYDGVVEDVGFRCTRLRTGADHVITIPNSALVNDSIENIGRRRTIQRTLNLGITYDTPREKVATAVDAIRDILEEPGIREPIHPVIGWDKHPPRVFFTDFTADSLNIQIVYHFAPPDGNDYMEHGQRVNLRIMEEFERLGVSFAFPSRTVYLANDSARGLKMRVANEDAA
jgi:potassium efflux system protein